jgi:L-fucose/D-arabinose isomerase
MKVKLGVLTFSDGKDITNENLKPVNQKYINILVDRLEKTGFIEPIVADTIIHNSIEAKEQAIKFRAANCHGVIFHYAVWCYPNLSAIAAGFIDTPILMYGNVNPEYPGLVGMLAAAGSLSQLNIKHLRLFGDIDNKNVFSKILSFAKTSYSITELRGQVYGIIGGRSMGMYTAVPCLAKWQRDFGIDIEHIDQLEIVRLSEEIDDDKVEKALKWLKENVGNISYDNKRLTEETLKIQIKHYYATKKIIEDHHLDFIGVKCHDELSSNYVTQCLAAAFINDPYDFDGTKEPMVYACEADSDGALTMQVFKLITGKPVLFMDLRHYDIDRNLFVFCNCGSQSTYYAAASDDYKENLKEVSLEPVGYILNGCGANVQYLAKEGEMTLARFMREGDDYWLAIIKAEAVKVDREIMRETTYSWPHVYIKLKTTPEELFEDYSSNHSHGVYGNWVKELIDFCHFKSIPYKLYE